MMMKLKNKKKNFCWSLLFMMMSIYLYLGMFGKKNINKPKILDVSSFLGDVSLKDFFALFICNCFVFWG